MKLHRIEFFVVLDKEDDGRANPIMTKEEFNAFAKNHRVTNERPPKSHLIHIYTEWYAYSDVSYSYCPANKTIYESEFYIGE